MKVYSYCEAKKWYKKIKWLKIFSFFLFFLFYIVIGNYNYLLRALWTSFIISFLISLGTLLSNCLKVKEVVFITKKNKLFICFVHNFDYLLVSYSDLKRIILGNNNFITDFTENPFSFLGIDVFEVEKVDNFKIVDNTVQINVLGTYNYWKESGGIFTSTGYEFVQNKKINKYFCLSIDYNNFNELLKIIEKYSN